ncbi:hypothetical protein QTP86_004981 [Hemibagrus guttatus]|nr:hypothetical protein QTP86_004981 [Hemibagrus guttatus]
MFASEATCGTHTDINTYTSSVLDYINTTIDSVTMEKQITTYHNQKPWTNKEVRLLLKARNTAFRSGDTQAYSISMANLMRGIKKAKYYYKFKVEEHFSNSDPRRMWQGIQAISGYKPSNSTLNDTDVSFLNELNDFYARFERDNKEKDITSRPSADHQTHTLTSTDVYNVLSLINTPQTTITLKTDVPQVLSPFHYPLFTHNCRPVYGSIIKIADDTTVIGLISDNDKTAYRAEVQHLVA